MFIKLFIIPVSFIRAAPLHKALTADIPLIQKPQQPKLDTVSDAILLTVS
jgi:hypothetical protein